MPLIPIFVVTLSVFIVASGNPMYVQSCLWTVIEMFLKDINILHFVESCNIFEKEGLDRQLSDPK